VAMVSTLVSRERLTLIVTSLLLYSSIIPMKRSASPLSKQPFKLTKCSTENDAFEEKKEIPLSEVKPSSSSFAFFKARLAIRRSTDPSSGLTSLQLKSNEYPYEYTVDIEICFSYSNLRADDLTPGDWFAITLTDAQFVSSNNSSSSTQLPWVLRYVGNWKMRLIKSSRRPDLESSVVYGIEGGHIFLLSVLLMTPRSRKRCLFLFLLFLLLLVIATGWRPV
jgi:hypothetical protein